MIEVVPDGAGWRWRMICAAGRVLVDGKTFPCNLTAFAAAKAYRSAFWRIADRVDYRMARCF